MAWLSARPRLAALYDAVVEGVLVREAASVLAGRVRYRRDTVGANNSYYLLRRNIHRLEKGLIMRPRRDVFAVEYLSETMDVYVRAITYAYTKLNNEHEWARDVLCKYFDVVDRAHPEIARQWARFKATEGHNGDDGSSSNRRVPYLRSLANASPVGFDSFMALSMRRRSVRWYRDQKVARDLVDQALAAANQAPSACNRQPFVYRIIDDPMRAQRIASIPLGTKGFADKLPAVVVLVGRLRAYPEPRDRHAIYIDGSLSAMAFMYALETLGIASCPINWPDIQPQEGLMKQELDLDDDERVIMLIAYGWPDPEGLVPYSAKRDLDQLRRFD